MVIIKKMNSIGNFHFKPAKLIAKIIDPVITTIKGTCDIRSETSSNERSPLTRFSISPLAKIDMISISLC